MENVLSSDDKKIGDRQIMHYDPSIGRYLTADPIGLDGGVNLYSYVLNNPMNMHDNFGLMGAVPQLQNLFYMYGPEINDTMLVILDIAGPNTGPPGTLTGFVAGQLGWDWDNVMQNTQNIWELLSDPIQYPDYVQNHDGHSFYYEENTCPKK
jgi:hypothetical protein